MKNGAGLVKFSFNSGEVSPYIAIRSDLQKYNASCKRIENFIITPQGAIKRRKGTKFLAEINNTDIAEYRVLPFEFSSAQSYIVLLAKKTDGETFINVYNSEGILKAENIEAPFTNKDIRKIQYAQSYDVLFLTHGEVFPQRLCRYADDDWRLENCDIRIQPTDETPIANLSISADIPSWNKATAYNSGTIVYNAGTTARISAVSLGIWKCAFVQGIGYRTWFWLKITLGANHGVIIGDSLNLAGISGNAIMNFDQSMIPVYWDFNVKSTIGEVAAVENDAVYTFVDLQVQERLTGIPPSQYAQTYYISAGAGTPNQMYSDYTMSRITNQFSISSQNNIAVVNQPTFYQAIAPITANTTELADSTKWRKRDSLSENIFVRASREYFTEDSVGDFLELNYGQNQVIKGSFSTGDKGKTSISIVASGQITLITDGIWDGVLELQESTDEGVTWNVIHTITSVKNSNNERATKMPSATSSLVRAFMKERGSAPSDNGCTYTLSSAGSAKCYLKVIEVIDEYRARVELLTPITKLFAAETVFAGAWSVKGGYPRTVAIYEERLFFGGSVAKPNTIWGSMINEWNNFEIGTLATSSVCFTLNSGTLDSIQWIYPKQHLLIGTDRNEWSLGSRNETQALTGESVFAKVESNYGSYSYRAIPAEDSLMFIRAGGCRVANVTYDLAKEGYTSDDMSVLAEHLFDTKIKEAYQQVVPNGVLWVLCDNGSIATFTYMPRQEVMGWSRQSFGDRVESFCIIRTDDVDSVMLVVRRGDKIFLEALSENNENYIDCFGSENPTPYTSIVEPVPLLLDGREAYGKNLILKGISLWLHKSRGGSVSIDGGKSYTAIEVYMGKSYKTTDTSGEVQLTLNSGYRTTADVSIKTNAEHPFNLMAIGVVGNKLGGQR